MEKRLLPILMVISLILFFCFAFFKKWKKNKEILKWNKKTNLIIGFSILSLHLGFSLYFIIYKGVYLYALHTDLCTMLYIWASIALIFNFEKILKIIMPWMIFGGTAEALSSSITFQIENIVNDITSLLKHLLLIFTGFYIFLVTSKYTWKTFNFSILWIVIFLIYIFFVVGIPYLITKNPKFGTYSTGLLPSSYEVTNVSWTKEYSESEFKILNIIGGYPWGTIILYIFATFVVFLISLIKIRQNKYIISINKNN